MHRALPLLLVVGLAYLVQQAAPAGLSDMRITGLGLGVALIAAALTGELLERLRLPRVTGYLIFGLICGPYLANVISRPLARELQVFNGLAVALIAVIAGLEMNLSRLRPRAATLIRIGGTTIAVLFLGLFLALWAAWPWLPIAPQASGVLKLSIVALTAALVTTFSPTVTIAVIAESRASGPLSQLTVALVVLADLALILLFSACMQLVRWASGSTLDDVGLLARLSWEILGSFAFGAALGAGFALYVKLIGRELTLALVGLCALLSEVGAQLHFEPVLAAVAAGLVVENIAPPDGDALKDAVERGALPILIIFFVAAGASLQLDALASLGLLAVAIAGLRLALIRAGTSLGWRMSALEPGTSGLVWMGLVSQAGVTLGLTMLVAAEFPEWGLALQALVIALIGLHQLVGPVLFRAALSRAGEIGRA